MLQIGTPYTQYKSCTQNSLSCHPVLSTVFSELPVTMRCLQQAALSSFLGLALALPAPQDAPGPVDPSQVLAQPPPPGASGSFRGPESLLGYSSSNDISTETTVIPLNEFELAPGQSEDARTGLYLDLKDVKNPQPIRGGTTGPTDPGPRSVTCHSFNVSPLTHHTAPQHTTA